jgi:hypothetical protein
MPRRVDKLSLVDLSKSNNILSELKEYIEHDKDEMEIIEYLKRINQIIYSKKITRSGLNMLMHACHYGLDNLAMYILKEEDTDLKQLDDNKISALMWAIRPNFDKVLLEMFKYDCIPDNVSDASETALMLACDHYYLDIIILLIKYSDSNGKNINEFHEGDDGITAFDYLLTGEYSEFVNNKKFITILKWFLHKYQEEMPASEVLHRNIERICSDDILLRNLGISKKNYCSKANPKAAVADILLGTIVDSPSKTRKTAKKVSKTTVAKKIPVVIGEMIQPDSQENRYVSPSEYDALLPLPRRPFPGGK